MKFFSRSLAATLLLAAAPAASAQCLTTLFASNNGGAEGGAVYFDFSANVDVTFSTIETNLDGTVGGAALLQVYVTPDTAVGKESDPSQWTLVGTAAGFIQAVDTPSIMLVPNPISIDGGRWGVALVAIGASHRYTNGSPTNASYADVNLTIEAGSASNSPFSSPTITPRVWNGTFCYEPKGKCLTTTFDSNNGGDPGGAVYFDIDAVNPIRINRLRTNYNAPAGTPVGLEVWTRSGTATGNTTSPAGWTMVGMDDGNATSNGEDVATFIELASPVDLPAGTTGVALVAVGSAHRYTNGSGGTADTFGNGEITLTLGGASNAPFAGNTFSPRVWNGTICYSVIPQCSTTFFASDNGGGFENTVYFNMNVASAIRWTGILTNYDAAGESVGVEVYLTPTTAAGKENSPGEWSLVAVDNGGAIGQAEDTPTVIQFAEDVSLPAGTYGVALRAINSSHEYTNGTGGNQAHTNGTVSMLLGSATNGQFSGNVFTPRVWNGAICYYDDAPIGNSYCGPAVPNSTGNSGFLQVFGSDFASDNSMSLFARNLPLNQFGYFLNSPNQGLNANPGGSQGNLCLGASIGRYNNQIFNTGSLGVGTIQLDLANTPTPSGLQAVMSGDTMNFTCWYRDANPGPTSNFTQAVEVDFQ